FAGSARGRSILKHGKRGAPEIVPHRAFFKGGFLLWPKPRPIAPCTPWATARPSLMVGESMGAGLWPALFQPNDVFPYRRGRRRAALRIPAFTGKQFMGAPPAPGGNRGMCRSPSRLSAAHLAAARGASHEAMPPRA